MTSVALVTGAGGGIGRAVADRLARAGHRVVGGDLAVGDDRRDPASVDLLHLDVTDTTSVESFVAHGLAIGALQVVVNCAGLLRPARTASLTDDQLESQVDVNLTGTVRVCRAVAPHLEESASIINVGSIAGTLGGAPGVGVYAATKAGVEGFTRAIACELGPRGVRANVVTPGVIDAPMAQMLRGDTETEARLVSGIPMRRLGRPEEVAEVIEFLASPRASYVTGATIRVDGGHVAS